MDILKMLTDLRQEREQITEAILVLERLAGTRPRRGRPPKWLAKPAEGGQQRTNGKRTFSAATRKKMALAQRRRWAARKKSEAGD